ncbi:MAG TPA: phosphoenolpyruvate synthase [Chloroflexota bacterium]|nr:phosphoenolpyruvate synthase [Chloroflexota bacterium]
MSYVKWFEEIGRSDVASAGGKGANLGEMTRAGLPVPPGFVVTVDAFDRFMRGGDLLDSIEERLSYLDPEDTAVLNTTAKDLQEWVVRAEVPDDVRTAVLGAYATLNEREGTAAEFVAVRSSATSEDAAAASFAGMFRSLLNVRGEAELLTALRECWASLFTARSIAYRARQGMLLGQRVAVVVQKMVDAEKSGVLFTVNPATGNMSHIVIEAAWGLGELIVQGDVRPDRYVVDKSSMRLLERAVNHKDFALVRTETGATERVALDDARASQRVLSDQEVRRIAELAVKDEQHYGAPQDAEWAMAGDELYFVQTRPVTSIAPRQLQESGSDGEILIRGLGASPGSASGPVRVLHSPEDGPRLMAGEILVTEMTSPDWVPIMRRAGAIVTDGGGMTSHAAIVSRELGVPCVVGTGRATHLLQDGETVTVDARAGVIRRGTSPTPAVASAGPLVMAAAAAPVTATKIYVNLGEPERAAEIAALTVDGVGLLRAEFMILSALNGRHPRLLIKEGQAEEFVDRMADNLRTFAAAFSPRPVVYRSMDFRSNEFRGLQGGGEFEPDEANPMIGYRGCFRYTREPDLFSLELRAIARVREQFSNLHLMIPFVRTRWEFAACKRLVDASGLTAARDFELWVMAEVPSIVYWLPEYAALGATGVSIGSNDLTQLVLGVDRDGETVAPLYDERDPAVLDAIRQIVEGAHRSGMTCSICGQAPSVYPDYAARLVQWGIDSISVTPDAIESTRRNVAAAELRLLLDRARGAPAAIASPAGRSAGARAVSTPGAPSAASLNGAAPAAALSAAG